MYVVLRSFDGQGPVEVKAGKHKNYRTFNARISTSHIYNDIDLNMP